MPNRSSNRGTGPKEHDANLTAYHVVQQATGQAEKEEPPGTAEEAVGNCMKGR